MRDAWRIAFLAGGAGLWVLLTTLHGPGLSPDSASYLSAARSWLEGNGFLGVSGEPVAHWPPGYPVALGPFLVVLCESAPRVLNALLHAITTTWVGWWLHARLGSRAIALGATVAVAFGHPLVWTASWAWSEPLFVLSTTGALLLASDVSPDRKETARLALLAILLTAAVMTRYLGVVVGAVVAAVFLLDRRGSLVRRLRWLVAIGAPSVVLLAAWLIRNFALFGAPTGPRGEGSRTLGDNVAGVFPALGDWFHPVPALEGGAITLAGGALVGLVAALGILRLVVPIDARREDVTARSWPLLLFVVLYTGGLVAGASLVGVDRLDLRLTSPLFVPLVLWMATALDATRVASERRVAGWARRVAAAAASAALVATVASTVVQTGIALREGVGAFASGPWTEIVPDVRRVVAAAERHGPVTTNLPDFVWLAAGQRTEMAPRWRFHASSECSDDLVAWARDLRSPEVLLWFRWKDRSFLWEPKDLERYVDLRPIERRPWGVVYAVEGRPSVAVPACGRSGSRVRLRRGASGKTRASRSRLRWRASRRRPRDANR